VLAPATPSDDAVRLLTIHGAKGLEARAVVLLDTDTAPRAADTMAVLVDWPAELARPKGFFFLASEAHPPVDAQATLEAEQVQRQREELNALYVAMTRARDMLVVSSIESHRDAPGSWWKRMFEHTDPHEAPSPRANPMALVGAEASGFFSMAELPASVLPVVSDVVPTGSPVADEVSDDSVVARVGKAIHRLLEWGVIDDHQVQGVRLEFRLDLQQGERAAEMARRILHGPGSWAWDPGQLNWHANEVELLSAGQVMRLDRLVQRRDNGEWWVLDHKSVHAPQDDPALVAQLRGYRDAVQRIHRAQTVRAAFLGGQGAWIELPANAG
jgi:ATP-dependent helicase/nuclease subunit A